MSSTNILNLYKYLYRSEEEIHKMILSHLYSAEIDPFVFYAYIKHQKSYYLSSYYCVFGGVLLSRQRITPNPPNMLRI